MFTPFQRFAALVMCLAGFACALLYDVLGLFRITGKKGWQIVADVLFFALSGVLFMAASIYAQLEGIRVYPILAACAGALLYRGGIGLVARRLLKGKNSRKE